MQNNHSPGPEPGGEKEPQEQEQLSTQDLVRRHLEDKDHVFTEEELKQVQVGQPNEEEYTAGVESATYFEVDDKGASDDEKGADEDDGAEGSTGRRATPWDVIE